MNRDELIAKMNANFCEMDGCDKSGCTGNREKTDTALAVFIEWLEDEAREAEALAATYTTAPSILAAEHRRLATILKGEKS